MKYFIDYDHEGLVKGVHSGDFPEGCNLSDPNCTHPIANKTKRHKDVVGTIPGECDCSKHCGCAWKAVAGKYVKDGQLIQLPDDVVFEIDGIDCKAGVKPVSKIPATSFSLIVKCESFGNSSVALYKYEQLPIDMHHDFPEPIKLLFTNGISQKITLVAPPQGFTAGVWLESGIRVAHLRIRGFAVS